MIHKILSLSGARLAIQTNLLYRRWKLVRSTLSFLNFWRYNKMIPMNLADDLNFIQHVLFNQNRQSQMKELKLSIVYLGSRWIIERFRDYVISHNVKSLQIDFLLCLDPHNLSLYGSQSPKQLKLAASLEFVTHLERELWSLSALIPLDLTFLTSIEYYKLPLCSLICLFSLETLCLNVLIFPNLSIYFLWQLYACKGAIYPKALASFQHY